MSTELPSGAFRAGFFSTVPAAEKAIADLLAANFSIEQLGIVCPEKFRGEFSSSIPKIETPSENSPMRIAEGATIGAVLGGVALAAATVATGGALFIPGAMVLIGGGALAGGMSNVIASDGYRRGVDEYYAHAHASGQIVIGVNFDGESIQRNREVAAILRAAGATALMPDDDPTLIPMSPVEPSNVAGTAQRLPY